MTNSDGGVILLHMKSSGRRALQAARLPRIAPTFSGAKNAAGDSVPALTRTKSSIAR